jgi:hypothetical protein
MQVPDFLDNGDPKTYQVLDHYLRTEPRADFASGCFNLGGTGWSARRRRRCGL